MLFKEGIHPERRKKFLSLKTPLMAGFISLSMPLWSASPESGQC